MLWIDHIAKTGSVLDDDGNEVGVVQAVHINSSAYDPAVMTIEISIKDGKILDEMTGGGW